MIVEKISARPVGAEKRIKNPRKSVAKRMEIYLIRHTSVSVEAGICYGQSDVPVAESFAAEAAQVRAKLPPPPLDQPPPPDQPVDDPQPRRPREEPRPE